MILILSNSEDLSTNDIIDWLSFFNVPFLRINSDNREKIDIEFELSNNSKFFQYSNGSKTFSLSQITALWYRRGGLAVVEYKDNITNAFDDEIYDDVNSHLNTEAKHLYDHFHQLLEQVPVKIGGQKSSAVNKLNVLDLAQSLGLKIPITKICMTKKQLLENVSKANNGLITKGIWEGLSASGSESGYSTYSEFLDIGKVNEFPESFFPSLVQANINKLYELRIFFLFGKFYSMAIFSQNDNQTQTDFRKYNDDRPNRNVPYNLPEKVKSKLTLLMQELALESGSIDMIVTPDKDYVFLEVNPVGQFGMTSVPCNYGIEKLIAMELSQR